MSVTVYTLPSCVQCDSTKKMLDRRSISYNVVDLSEDEAALEMIRNWGYQAAPVVVAGDDHWSGFRPDRLNAIAAQAAISVYDIIYFSNVSNNTHKFVQKLNFNSRRIPLRWDGEEPWMATSEYVLFVPTYGGGNDRHTVPKQVIKFLNIKKNRDLMRGVVGLGNTNFGEHYCKAADIVAAKVGVPLLYRVEITGTPDDVKQVTERLEKLWTITATMN